MISIIPDGRQKVLRKEVDEPNIMCYTGGMKSTTRLNQGGIMVAGHKPANFWYPQEDAV